MKPRPQRSRSKAFTLVELLVALGIFGLVMGALITFSRSSTRVIFESTLRLDLDRDLRQSAQRILADVNTADAFYLYKSFKSSDRNATNGSQRLGSDASGDFLLLVYSEPQPLTTSNVYVTRLVGYFRKADTASARGGIHRFQIDYADQTVRADSNPVESLLASYSYNDEYPRLIPSAAGGYTNGMFYNFRGKTVMISADLYRGASYRNSTEVLRLCASPR
jgi:prepilin-type N-terminal cleavage/methylation domain-containing protein